jgi:hypothetical protein
VTPAATPTPAAAVAPPLHRLSTIGLAAAFPALVEAEDRLRSARSKADVNVQGGDPGHQWDSTLVVRHAVNYWLAVEAVRAATADAAQPESPAPVVDVGAGAGALSTWAAALLGRDLVLVEPDDGHRQLAAAAFPTTTVVSAVDQAPSSDAVLAMEVLEHVYPAQQHDFLAALASRVLPGGVLVLSTPDESGYVGGWSGYAPHVGCVDAPTLHRLVSEQTGWPVTVLRIQGPGFDLSRFARVGVPVANRAWTATQRLAKPLADALTRAGGRLGRHPTRAAKVDETAFTITPAQVGTGTGLLAVATRPR